ncbi:Transposase protein [Popillia japonica]|uniref:Transposase protein n=1 Tax=Popillia japonica TaxID=7064 RepID=A0AAW1LSU7_POPJA
MLIIIDSVSVCLLCVIRLCLSMEAKKRRGAARYCAVPSCENNSVSNEGYSFFSFPKQTNSVSNEGKIPDLAEQSHNVGEANICQTQVHVLPDAELTPEAVDDNISEPEAADDVFVPKPGPSHSKADVSLQTGSLLTQNTPRKTKLRRELLKVKRRVLRLQSAPEAIPTKQGFLKQCDIHLSSELAAIVKFNELPYITGFFFAIVVHIDRFRLSSFVALSKMVGKRNCAVLGCRDESSSRHRFPNPVKFKLRYMEWIKVCGNKKLITLDPDLVYRSYRVCHIHFHEKDHASNMYLIKTAIPTLHLPQPLEENETDQAGVSQTDEHVMAKFQKTEASQRNISSTPTLQETQVGTLTLPEIDVDTSTLQQRGGVDTLQEIDVAETVECVTPESNKRRRVFDKEMFNPSPAPKKAALKDEECVTPKSHKTGIYTTDTRSHLLAEVGVRRSQELTPKARHLYKGTLRLKKVVRIYRRRNLSFRKRLALAEKSIRDGSFWNYSSSANSELVRFCQSQYRLASKSPKGRRYTLDEKIMSLAIYKQSGRGYRFLSKMFSLPTPRTLRKLLANIELSAGLNDIIINDLKFKVRQLKSHSKLCVLMFDEISLTPSLRYNKDKDEIEGLEDVGDIQRPEISQYAQVFMIRGLFKKWKQPISYMFTKSPMKTEDLSRCLKLSIKALHEAGLTVIATICDQGSTNQSTINKLIEETRQNKIREGIEWRNHSFIVNNKEIIAIYDPPHLLKGIRNNLLTKDLIWKQDKKVVTAKWSDIEKAYLIDAASGDIRALPRITERHVNPQKLKKMKVSYCTQVFSQSMAAAITIMARNNERSLDGKVVMEPRAKETAVVIELLDRIFDSINGGSTYNSEKGLRCAVTKQSQHINFWAYAAKEMQQMYFVNPTTGEKHNPPSLKNWVKTLHGFQEIFKKISSYNIKYFLPRRVNQDSLENLFGQIRQQGARDVNPTVTTFKCHFKTLLIHNMTAPHSLGANCEEQFTSGDYLVCLKTFLNKNLVRHRDTPNLEDRLLHLSSDLVISNDQLYRQLDISSVGYVSGLISKEILKKFTCEFCKIHILSNRGSININEPMYQLSVEKEFNAGISKKLHFCRPTFILSITKAYNIIKYLLNKLCNYDKCGHLILEYVKKHVDFTFIC